MWDRVRDLGQITVLESMDMKRKVGMALWLVQEKQKLIRQMNKCLIVERYWMGLFNTFQQLNTDMAGVGWVVLWPLECSVRILLNLSAFTRCPWTLGLSSKSGLAQELEESPRKPNIIAPQPNLRACLWQLISWPSLSLPHHPLRDRGLSMCSPTVQLNALTLRQSHGSSRVFNKGHENLPSFSNELLTQIPLEHCITHHGSISHTVICCPLCYISNNVSLVGSSGCRCVSISVGCSWRLHCSPFVVLKLRHLRWLVFSGRQYKFYHASYGPASDPRFPEQAFKQDTCR